MKKQLSEIESSQKDKSSVTTSSSFNKRDKPATSIVTSKKDKKIDGFTLNLHKKLTDVKEGKGTSLARAERSSAVEAKSVKEGNSEATERTKNLFNAKDLDNSLAEAVSTSSTSSKSNATGDISGISCPGTSNGISANSKVSDRLFKADENKMLLADSLKSKDSEESVGLKSNVFNTISVLHPELKVLFPSSPFTSVKQCLKNYKQTYTYSNLNL